jgi:hypothetical protein
VQESAGVKRLVRCLLVIGAAAVLGPRASSAAPPGLYRIELAGSTVLFAKTPPVPRGARIVFARYPDGAVMSLKASDVRRVVLVPVVRANGPSLKPGELLVLGPTGEGGSASAPAGAGGARPGETPPGKAPFNPARDYRPEWDARQVPGQTLPFPASPGDYREGGTLSYPPGNATQSGPGQPPTGVPSGDAPRMPR